VCRCFRIVVVPSVTLRCPSLNPVMRRSWINAWMAGKTVWSLDNACHTWALLWRGWPIKSAVYLHLSPQIFWCLAVVSTSTILSDARTRGQARGWVHSTVQQILTVIGRLQCDKRVPPYLSDRPVLTPKNSSVAPEIRWILNRRFSQPAVQLTAW